jgi:WD40 repeat protein
MTLSGLGTGSHTLVLSGLSSNCTLSGPNSRQIMIASHETAQVSFAVACVALASIDIAGVWDWTEQYVNPVCHDTGTYAFTQSGATFTGRSDQVGSCETPNGPADNTRSADLVSAGQVATGTITFQVGSNAFCFYTATITGNPPDRLSGTTTCGASTGTWEAVRGQPVARITVTPSPDTVLEGATVQLAVQLWDAAGHRVFRTVVWSSDKPAVAVVSDSGKVTTASAGTATITATAAGASSSVPVIVQRAGTARITTATTGVDVDLDGYRAYVDGSWDGSQAVGINGTVLLTRIKPGSRSILLGQVASNCTVTGTNPVAITVAGGDTIPLAFRVACVRTQRIAFASSYNVGIYVMSATGADAARLISNATYTEFGHPAWSPDGTRIAFQSTRDGNEELYVMSADGTGVTRLTNNAVFDGEPAWSPDGTKIAFQSTRDGNAQIYVMNPDGSGVTRLTNDPAAAVDPAWSPDGTKIAFASNRDGNSEIYVMNADGSSVTRLTTNPALDAGPSWSPDGTRIAFRSDRDGNAQIYVMNADGLGVTRLTNNADGDLQPAWSPDGSRIAFTKIVQSCDPDYGCDVITSVWVMNADGSAVTPLPGTGTGLDSDPAWRP